jgi:hypothetical protein
MSEAKWLACSDPTLMLKILSAELQKAKVAMPKNDLLRKYRLFAVAVCRQLWPLLNNHGRRAVELIEQYAEGARKQTLLKAREAQDEAMMAEDEDSGALAKRADFAARAAADARYEATAAILVAAAGRALSATKAYYSAGSALGFKTCARRLRSNPAAVRSFDALWDSAQKEGQGAPYKKFSILLRDLFGNPFRPVVIAPSWLKWNSATVPKLARAIHDDRDFDRLPILADALEDAGCDNTDILTHCRGPGPHVRGCWVVDLILGKA